ncbi:uncharacterized protein LOC118457378 isoform X2 [Anopheles albimanus]|uniref:uncharacterized protein LOC118457378 isoform X2 n=1 Tax=Anopheles albimanus TaxID=7167 RepID=UPI00163FDCB3|nr:uncharacterized protein LOC118457378 isoform X2 [Anopheles albimanus]
MRLIATCVLCKVKLSCEPANTRILIDHLQRLHCLQPPSPGESKPFSPIMPQPQKLKNNLRTAAVKETKNQANVAAPTSVESTGSNLRTGTRRRIAYKTTVHGGSSRAESLDRRQSSRHSKIVAEEIDSARI